MYRLTVLRRQGGSDAVVLPRRAVRAARWPNPAVPLRPALEGSRIVLAPDPVLADIARALEPHRPKVRTALVYGSYVRGDWTPGESDIDLFIIAEEGVERPARRALNDVFLKHLVPISVQFYTPRQAEEMADSRYFAEVFRTGVPLWAT